MLSSWSRRLEYTRRWLVSTRARAPILADRIGGCDEINPGAGQVHRGGEGRDGGILLSQLLYLTC